MNFGIGSSSSRGGPSRPVDVKPVVVPLTLDIINKFRPAKHFKDAVDPESSSLSSFNNSAGIDNKPNSTGKSITSLCFDDSGEKLVTAGNDDMFVLWDCKKGKKIKPLYSKKYGIDLPRFTHKAGNIVHASTKGDDHAVRYHSMHDNKYLAYFKGHQARVRSVHMSPVDDTFVTAGDDGTVRLWDLRAQGCKGLVNDVGGSAIAAFDNQGIIFAVACSETQTIMMYATNTMDRIPFAYTPFNDIQFGKESIPPPKPIFTSMSFSSNGEYLLIGTSSDVHYLIDAIDLIPLRRLIGHQGLGKERTDFQNGQKGITTLSTPKRGISGEEVSFTSDSKFIISGSADGDILFWDLSSSPSREDSNLNPIDGNGKLTRNELENGKKLPSDIKWHTLPIPDLKAKVILKGNTNNNSSGNPSSSQSRAVRFNNRLQMFAVGGEDLTFWIPEKDEDSKVQQGW
ncbi:uncharacterized protein L201_003089 [Kwoniella dendrophila CBS 6074]|uniref:Compass component swd2 n=1 Tax=Kwoniella dendrophila CBS 6074 TaxID=1295534 RepID=A0AAX4JSD4_9TREE